MDYNELRQGIKISGLGFGCARLGKSLNEDNTAISNTILQLALDHGINYFDTSTTYSYGDSEKILGSFLEKAIRPVVISSKGGKKLSDMAKYAQYVRPLFRYIKPLVRNKMVVKKNKKVHDFSYESLLSCLRKSLRRMRLSKLPIYKLHNPPSNVLNDPSIPKFFNKIKNEGLVTLTGISIQKLSDIKKCTYLNEVDVIQFPMNYIDFKPEYVEILSKLKEMKIGMIGRSPFSRGLLTSRNEVRTGQERGSKNKDIILRKEELCKQFNVGEIQLALWFLRDMKILDSILFSSFNPIHLAENVSFYESPVPESFNWKDLVEL